MVLPLNSRHTTPPFPWTFRLTKWSTSLQPIPFLPYSTFRSYPNPPHPLHQTLPLIPTHSFLSSSTTLTIYSLPHPHFLQTTPPTIKSIYFPTQPQPTFVLVVTFTLWSVRSNAKLMKCYNRGSFSLAEVLSLLLYFWWRRRMAHRGCASTFMLWTPSCCVIAFPCLP